MEVADAGQRVLESLPPPAGQGEELGHDLVGVDAVERGAHMDGVIEQHVARLPSHQPSPAFPSNNHDGTGPVTMSTSYRL